jgi:hypothetical protein
MPLVGPGGLEEAKQNRGKGEEFDFDFQSRE